MIYYDGILNHLLISNKQHIATDFFQFKCVKAFGVRDKILELLYDVFAIFFSKIAKGNIIFWHQEFFLVRYFVISKFGENN